jgi:hypothetical protein
MRPIPNSFQDRAIGMYSCKIVDKKDIIYKFGTVYLVQVTRVLGDFALTRLENLHNFSNSHDNFCFNVIFHRQFVIALVLFTW